MPYHALDTETESSRDTERLRSLGSPAPSTHTHTHTHTHTKVLEYNFSCMSISTIPLIAMPCQVSQHQHGTKPIKIAGNASNFSTPYQHYFNSTLLLCMHSIYHAVDESKLFSRLITINTWKCMHTHTNLATSTIGHSPTRTYSQCTSSSGHKKIT